MSTALSPAMSTVPSHTVSSHTVPDALASAMRNVVFTPLSAVDPMPIAQGIATAVHLPLVTAYGPPTLDWSPPDAGVRPPLPRSPVGPVAWSEFMFATGIECSNPLIAGNVRVDQLATTGHYEHWQTDLRLVTELGLRHLRYGPPNHRIWTRPGEYDWDFTDRVLDRMRDLGIVPLIDLVHFGLPDWLVDFQNDRWPDHFADYARAFAGRYGWVRHYTPVNEIYVTAQFSAARGFWNERQTSERGFVRNLRNSVRATSNAIRAIRDVRPDAVFVLSESTEYVHPSSPSLVEHAAFLNERRFLSLDLLFGHPVSERMAGHLRLSGLGDEDREALAIDADERAACLLGTDYYVTNEHLLHPNGQTSGVGDVYGYSTIARQYYDRYHVPLMHTETNRVSGVAGKWLWKQWMNLTRLRDDHVPVHGFTWYGLVDMTDWDSALTRQRGHVCKVGLFDLHRRARPAAREFRRLIEQYADLIAPAGVSDAAGAGKPCVPDVAAVGVPTIPPLAAAA